MQWMRERGVGIDAHGVARCTAELASPEWQPELTTTPMPRRQRHMWDALDRASISSLSDGARERLEECSGPEGGAYLVAGRTELGTSLTDTEWRSYTKLRLGMPIVAAMPCQLVRVSKDERRICGAMMDTDGRHCIACKVGGAVTAAHGEGCQIIAEAAREAGFTSRREQVIPELATASCPSPVMDVDGWGVPGADRLLLDFTMRSGAAARYRWGQRAQAAASAEDDKTKRYPPAGGLLPRGIGMEVLGRHGPELRSLLAELADRARHAAVLQGKAPTRLLRKWRCQLSGVAARLVGRQASQSQALAARTWEGLPHTARTAARGTHS